MRRAVFLALALAACQPAPHETPIAAGSLPAILNTARVARRCGVRDTRVVPLDHRRARLLLGDSHPQAAERCLFDWIGTHPRGLDGRVVRG